MISFGEDLPVEIKLTILEKLIPSRNFSSDLLRFSQVSIHAQALTWDKTIWRKAIKFYFPYIKTSPDQKFNNLYNNNPQELFKKLYQHAAAVLKSENLTFADFNEFLLSNNIEIPQAKQNVLIGLCVATGQNKNFSQGQLTLAKNHCLLFSAALNNKAIFVQIFNAAIPPAAEFKRAALLISAEYGFVTICAVILAHSNGIIDRATLCEAFIKVCAQGHLRAAQVFLTRPTLPSLTFSLSKALNTVCANGNAEITAELLKVSHLKNNFEFLKEAIIIAFNSGKDDVVQLLLQEEKLSKNLLLMINLFKQCVQMKSKAMVAKFVQQPRVTFSVSLIVDSIKQLIDSGNYDIAEIILHHKLDKISSFARRDICYSAAQKGAFNLVQYILESDAEIFSQMNLGQVLRLAADNNHEEIVSYLLENHGDSLSSTVLKYLMSTPCYQSSQQLQEIAINKELNKLTKHFSAFSIEKKLEEQVDKPCLFQFGHVRNKIATIEKNSDENFTPFKAANRQLTASN